MTHLPLDDQDILRLFRQRTPLALIALEEKYGGYCYTIAYGILKNPADTEECLNDILFHCWNALPQSHPRHLKAYLGTVARNQAIDYYRKHHTLRRGGAAATCSLAEDRTYAPTFDPDECGTLAVAQCLDAFLSARRPEERQLFLRHYRDGEPVAELARHFGLTESCVRGRLTRLKARLRQQLREYDIYIS